jgi:dephospho-CoA kinase
MEPSPPGPNPVAAAPGLRPLDADTLALCQDLSGRLFPWDTNRALELALLKTFCLPSISALLQQTGEFSTRPRKRYDDTGLMVAELVRLGPDSPGGAAVIERLNRIHGTYAIKQADFLYVLSGFVAEPIRWLQRYGWRPMNAREQQALFRFWDHVGALMGIAQRPQTLEALLALNTKVEKELFAAAESNHHIAEATLSMLLRGWPAPLQPLLRAGLRSLLDPAVLRGLQWQPAPALLGQLVMAALRGRSLLLNLRMRSWPPRQQRFFSERPTPSYGRRFQLEQLGPPPLLERLNRPRWRGSQHRIGLTGSIATGKSAVGRLLAAQGLPVLDADAYAREALAPGSPAAQAVLARYGETVRAIPPSVASESPAAPDPQAPDRPAPDHDHALAAVDRAALGRIVFNDPAERQWLEQLLHPLVRSRFEAELQRLEQAPRVVLMIPLLFEAGLEGLCSEVWLVTCTAQQQRQRLIARDQLSAAEADARIHSQWPMERKQALADIWIDNRQGLKELEQAVAAALERTAASPRPGFSPPAA